MVENPSWAQYLLRALWAGGRDVSADLDLEGGSESRLGPSPLGLPRESWFKSFQDWRPHSLWPSSMGHQEGARSHCISESPAAHTVPSQEAEGGPLIWG